MSGHPVIALRAVGTSSGAPRDLEDAFGGRWSARREMWRDARPLIHAVGRALESAGWWRPGSGEGVDAGQVVGVDLHSREPAARFGAAGSAAAARATDFLFALPSSAAALVGIAFGLERYQATLAMHGMSGYAALSHACDALRTGRVERLVAAALTAAPDDSDHAGLGLAVAWCLEAGDADAMRDATRIDDCVIESGCTTAEGSAGTDSLAAPSMFAATAAIRDAAPGSTLELRHRDFDTGQSGTMTMQLGSRQLENSRW